jgi:ferredoxin--NADP+ reductase
VAGVEVSVFDRLPTPFGLARAGVAPDHLSTKDVTKFFGKVLRRPNVSCYFNVEVGKDVSLEELTEHHHAVVLAVGADTDRELGIEGEDMPGSASAREFVSWYNGHPDHGTREFDLAGQRVVIIGNGNVGLDAARLLVSDPDELESSDMAQHALDRLRDSGVREVVVAARRGVLDAAYTTSELMALSRLDGVDLVALPDEVNAGDDKRLDQAQVRRKHAVAAAASPPGGATADRRITLRYGLTPESINGDGQVESVTFRRTGADPFDSDATETIEAGLVLRAIGYRSSPIVGVPFDQRTGTIAHDNGRVRDQTGLYCVGWAKRGPTGVIGTNQVCATETVAELFADFANGLFAEPETSADELSALISSRNPAVVDFSGWQDIDAAERARGELVSRPRVKFISIDEMLAAVRA